MKRIELRQLLSIGERRLSAPKRSSNLKYLSSTPQLLIQCVKILTKCREAVTDDGRIVIANQDLPSTIEGPHPNLTMDIQMMALLGGRERSVVEWTELFSRADFRLATSFQTSIGFTLIEGMPD